MRLLLSLLFIGLSTAFLNRGKPSIGPKSTEKSQEFHPNQLPSQHVNSLKVMMSNQPTNWFSSFQKPKSSPVSAVKKFETTVIPQNYNVAIGSALLGFLIYFASHDLSSTVFFVLFGVFLALQTSKVRFLFDDEAIEVVVQKGDRLDKTRYL
jgi:hypothetical protein